VYFIIFVVLKLNLFYFETSILFLNYLNYKLRIYKYQQLDMKYNKSNVEF